MTDDDIRRLVPLPPRRRPNPLAIAVRWRAELLVTASVAGAWHAFGGTSVAVGSILLAGLIVAIEPVRKLFRGLVQCVIVMHRVRSGLMQGVVVDRSGRLPWVVAARPHGDDTVWVTLWLRSGTTTRDIARALTVITTACAATHTDVVQYSARQDRLAILVVRPRWGWWTN